MRVVVAGVVEVVATGRPQSTARLMRAERVVEKAAMTHAIDHARRERSKQWHRRAQPTALRACAALVGRKGCVLTDKGEGTLVRACHDPD
jgi:hypothetical protein